MSNGSKHKTRESSEFPMQEGILSLVIGGLNRLLELNCVNYGGSGTNVQDLHDRVVNGIERREEIQIPSDEHQKEELMRSDRDSC